MQPRGIIGDNAFDLPMTEINETDLAAERNMAKFSRTKEFKALKEHLEARIAFYQTFLPDGRIVGTGEAPSGQDWLVANTVISEFKALISTYETANVTVTEAKVAG